MMKKAIFGGTFDPIHKGHLYIAHEAVKYLNLDELIFMPSGNPPHKSSKKVTEAAIRYEMVEAAICGEEKFAVCDYEIKKKSYSYTYETLEEFNRREPETEWYFVVGLDCLMEFDTWKNVDKILNCCSLVVFNREGYSETDVKNKKEEVERRYNKKIYFLDIPAFNLSSSFIRDEIKQRRSVEDLLPHKVYQLVNKFNLYR